MVRPKSSFRSRTSQPQPTPPQPTIPMNEPTNQPFSLGVQTRLGRSRGRGVHVATPSHFGGHLNFSKTADQQCYPKCCERRIIPCKCYEKIVIDALGKREEVERMFTVISW